MAVGDTNKIFINGEDIDLVGLTADDLDKLEETFYRIYKPDESKEIYLFIDEVQGFPEWQKWLRTLFDQHKYKIVVSGSTSDLVLDRLHSELRGRAINTLVLPFSFAEYVVAKGGIKYAKHMKIEEHSRLVGALSEFIDYGGYPEVVKATDAALRQDILSALYSTVVQHDIVEKYKIRKIQTFKAFANSLFGSVCRELSVQNMVQWFRSQGTNISSQTAWNYINYAQASFLFFLVYQYSTKIKERGTKPKIYVVDSGMLGLFEPYKAKKLENQVFIELLRRHKDIYYYKSGAADVDFVIVERNTVVELVQVSYSINDYAAYEREVKSLLLASDKLNCKKLTIITFDEEKKIRKDGRIIDVVPAWRWFLG